MSHIDSFKHALVGDLFGIPVYLSLEDIDGDFSCPAKTLIIGGGSGEHPSAVLINPLAAVARFLDAELFNLKLGARAKMDWAEACRPYISAANTSILQYALWLEDDYAAFRQRCANPHAASPYYQSEMDIEDWLILGLGEFIFFAMPDLAMDIVGHLTDPYRYFLHVRYSNIMLVPPNFPVYSNGGNAFASTLRY